MLVIVLAFVLAVAGVGAALARLARLPVVIGQMTAGVLVGPLGAGALWPGTYADWFTPDTREVLATLGTVAACVFLFGAGAAKHGGARLARGVVARITVVNALAAVAGAVVVLAVVGLTDAADRLDGTQSVFLALVLTACALPVLLRIIEEKSLAGTAPARTAVAVAVVTDIGVWVAVAVLGTVRSDVATGSLVWGMAVLVVVVSLVVVLRQRIHTLLASVDHPLVLLVAALLCAGIGIGVCELAGLDPLIGALLGGTLFGSARGGSDAPWFLRARAFTRTNTWVTLPIFFASAGIAARPVTGGPTVLLVAAVMIVAALGARVAAVYAAGRGVDAGDRRTLLWLLSARGGTELALLAAGLELGLLPRELYPPAVLMAVVTTVFAGTVRRGDAGTAVPVRRTSSPTGSNAT